MHERIFLGIAGAFGALSIALDAAARHALAGDAQRLEFATIAARYGLVHAAALVGVALLWQRYGAGLWLGLAGWLLVAGLVLVCGSLALLAAGAPPFVALLTPWGGGAFIAGWLALLAAAVTARR